jgi:hypothetical protein
MSKKIPSEMCRICEHYTQIAREWMKDPTQIPKDKKIIWVCGITETPNFLENYACDSFKFSPLRLLEFLIEKFDNGDDD